MATEIVNNTGGIVTLPPNLGSFILGAGRAVVVGYTEAEVVAILSVGAGFPVGLGLRTVPNAQLVQPVSAIANDFLASIKSSGGNTPPSVPVPGDRYIIGTSPTGAWAGHASQIAQWSGSAWIFTAPTAGTQTFNEATLENLVFTGTTWEPVGGGGGGISPVGESTTGAMDIVIDYDNGYDGPALSEVVFHNQAEVDAYLLGKGYTSFKFPTRVWDRAIPQYIQYRVRFYMQPGIHRPENPLPAAAVAAWDFSRKDLPPHVFSDGGYLSLYQGGPVGEDYYNTWESLFGDLAIASYVNVSPDGGITPSSITVVGTPLGADNSLVGYYAIANNGSTPRPIIKNTADTVWLLRGGSGTPTSVRILRPVIHMRNSYDDIAKVKNTVINLTAVTPGGYSYLNLDSLNIEQMGAACGVYAKDIHVELWGCLFDQARQRDLFGITSFSNYAVWLDASNHGYAGARAYYCGYRGPRYAASPITPYDPFKFTGPRHGTLNDVANVSLISNAVGGFDTLGTFICGTLFLDSTRCVDHLGSGASVACTFKSMRLLFPSSQEVTSGFERFRGGMDFYNCVFDMSAGGTGNHLMFGGGLVSTTDILRFWYDNYTTGGPLRVRQGIGANAGRPIFLIGPRNNIQLAANSDLAGGVGPVVICNQDYNWQSTGFSYSYAQLQDLRYPRSQPEGTLRGVVTVIGVDSGTVMGLATLRYTAVGTLLAYKALASGDFGPDVDVSAGGIFTLTNALNKSIQVRIEKSLLPVADDLQTFDISRGFVDWAWTQNRVGVRFA